MGLRILGTGTASYQWVWGGGMGKESLMPKATFSGY